MTDKTLFHQGFQPFQFNRHSFTVTKPVVPTAAELATTFLSDYKLSKFIATGMTLFCLLMDGHYSVTKYQG